MSESFCQLCGGRFPVEELKNTVCPLCLEIQKQPRAKRPVMGVDDITFTGEEKSALPFILMAIGFVVVLLFCMLYWPRKQIVDVDGLKEISVKEVLENLSEEESSSHFLLVLERSSQRKVIEEILLIESHLENEIFLEKLTSEVRFFYRFSVKKNADGIAEIRATPQSMFARHYLMVEKKNIHYNNDGPASLSDPSILRPMKKKSSMRVKGNSK